MERWQQIESVFHDALERPHSEREAYVRQACAHDRDLHREVSSLLASYRDDVGFGPWAAAAAAKLISAPATLAAGEHLGPYEILSFIAAGGMGAVYRAHDPRTGRQVAIKVSAERFGERFEREVRTIAALNHPNICTLYDVGPNYLVMELVEGVSPKGPIPLETALDYALQIADALEEEPPSELGTAKESRARNLSWILAAAAITAAIALGFVAYRHFTEETGRPNALQLSLLLPEKATFNDGSVPAVSPDGRWLAFSAIVNGQQGLWVRDLDALATRLLPLTDGAMYPFWSPDSRRIGFFTTSGKLKKIEVAGGPAITVCDAEAGRGGTWNQNDVIVYAINGGGLFRVSAAGGIPPIRLLNPDAKQGEPGRRTPWFLPDGRHFLYTARAIESADARVYVTDLESANHIEERRVVLAADSNAIYVPPGYLLFVRDRTLMAQSFDPARFQTTGDAVPVAEGVDYHGTSTYAFSASKTGLIIYISGGRKAQMTWFDRAGQPLGTVGTAGEVRWAAISPDGSTVAYDRRDEQTGYPDIPSSHHICAMLHRCVSRLPAIFRTHQGTNLGRKTGGSKNGRNEE